MKMTTELEVTFSDAYSRLKIKYCKLETAKYEIDSLFNPEWTDSSQGMYSGVFDVMGKKFQVSVELSGSAVKCLLRWEPSGMVIQTIDWVSIEMPENIKNSLLQSIVGAFSEREILLWGERNGGVINKYVER